MRTRNRRNRALLRFAASGVLAVAVVAGLWFAGARGLVTGIGAVALTTAVAFLVKYLLERLTRVPPPPLDRQLAKHLDSVVQSLEERRTRSSHDLQSDLLDFYIDARGAREPPPRRGADVQPGAERLADLVMASVNRRVPCIVLADFGMGKTWFLEHFRYSLAEAALAEGLPDHLIPLRVSLRGWTAHGLMFRELRRHAWTVALGEKLADSREADLVELYEAGRFVFLLDGLDELAGSTPEDRGRVLQELGSLGEHAKRSAVVLTSRRGFFASESTEQRLSDLGFDVYYLWPWSRDDIVSYLRKLHAQGALGPEPETMVEQLEQTHDLRDLASRAMLSAMLADQWDTIASNQNIDLPLLYERHVEKAVLDWVAPKAWKLEKHEIKECMEEIAFLMFRLGSLEVSPSELDRYFSRQPRWRGVRKFSKLADSLARDIKTNSLPVRDGDSYAFCHTSIWEFMVARRLIHELADASSGGFRIPSRTAQYDSIHTHFLVPMLEKEGKLGLLSSLFARRV